MKSLRGCLWIIVVSIVLSIGLAMLAPRPNGGNPQPATPAAASPSVPVSGVGAVRLTPQDFGGQWPLRVDAIVLSCQPEMGAVKAVHAVLATANGVTYAVNGTAKSRAKRNGWENFNKLFPGGDDPSYRPTMEEGDFRSKLIERGLTLCE